MDPISANLTQPSVQQNQEVQQTRTEAERQQTQTATVGAEDSVVVSSTLDSLQLQRTQVVTDIAKAQQSSAEANTNATSSNTANSNTTGLSQSPPIVPPFPRRPEAEVQVPANENEARELAQSLRQQVQESSGASLEAQAAEKQTTLTLF